jgi:hypothetical protein
MYLTKVTHLKSHRAKLFLTTLLGLMIASCSNHTDPHIYFLQVQKQAIGENIKNHEKRHHLKNYLEKTNIENGNTIFKYERYRNCIEIIEINSNNIIVGVGVGIPKSSCIRNQN